MPLAALALWAAACGGDDVAIEGPVSTAGVSTTTTGPVRTTVAEPTFTSSVAPVTADELGASWHEGCPLPPDELRTITLTHWGFDAAVHDGQLVVAAAEVQHVVAVFDRLFDERFPIERMEPVAAYDGDDDASMAVNNTSGFNCRTVKGSTKLSEHAYGRAIDVNPLRNPYVYADGRVDPPLGAPYADRARTDAGLIHDGDPIVAAFADQGWAWGGRWSGGKDYQHFSAGGG